MTEGRAAYARTLGMSSTPPTPPEPEEGPGPAFPGFKMALGAPERAEPPAAEFGYTQSLKRADARWRRVAFWVALVIAVALIVWFVLA